MERARSVTAEALGSAMKRILTINDMYGGRPVREAVLNEINGAIRLVDRTLYELCHPQPRNITGGSLPI